ncbi:hypothetical protein RRG08_043355 [Elysia crispata]|uniref:Uncharacterized protein n=1 Tax=Elysia crispata TaxID=231223 RepID=A0AAE0Z5C6_9GAST|nr:hypothetical protein RRG08_043355 [Elysia crispata]
MSTIDTNIWPSIQIHICFCRGDVNFISSYRQDLLFTGLNCSDSTQGFKSKTADRRPENFVYLNRKNREYLRGKNREYLRGKNRDYLRGKNREYLRGKNREYLRGKNRDYLRGKNREYLRGKNRDYLRKPGLE